MRLAEIDHVLFLVYHLEHNETTDFAGKFY